MIKFLYVVSLGITSFLLFIFSKEKDDFVCDNQVSGTIALITDSTGSYLGLITEEDKVLHPSSMSEDIILAAGQKVTICYNVDSSKYVPENVSVPVNIKSVSYLSP
ncbi:hypothetical protein [Agriterribacter sp.]|uniref:hypothetical protein n=1 Tax=Agriterribacter sp. TaxID=2821509 RepID=UPI002CDC4DEA|nr:hypothetical protein [Agriterribacter sp.]HTN07913.1 hypothetical protein [Agriterribacter sp.]